MLADGDRRPLEQPEGQTCKSLKTNDFRLLFAEQILHGDEKAKTTRCWAGFALCSPSDHKMLGCEVFAHCAVLTHRLLRFG